MSKLTTTGKLSLAALVTAGLIGWQAPALASHGADDGARDDRGHHASHDARHHARHHARHQARGDHRREDRRDDHGRHGHHGDDD